MNWLGFVLRQWWSNGDSASENYRAGAEVVPGQAEIIREEKRHK